MSSVLYNCYAISTAFTGLFIPITVPSTILKNIDYEENGSTEWLHSLILFQLYITVFSFLCLLAIQATIGTIYGADIKRSVHKVMFMKNPCLLTVDVLLFYLTISLTTILTEEQQWKIVGPLLICRCFQTFLTTMMANLVNYDIAATPFVYHYHFVCFVSSIFIPIMVKNEIEKFRAIQTYGVTLLWSLLSFYKNTSKAVVLSAIWLILWNDEALSDVIFHRYSHLRTFAVEAIYIPAGLFWFTFMVGLICFRLPDVWPILTMLQFMHSCGLWFIREIVDYKLKRLDPMSPVFHDLQAQDDALVAEMDAALGDLERELNDLAVHLENIRSQRRQQTNGGQRNQNQQLVGLPNEIENSTIQMPIPSQNTAQHGQVSTLQNPARFGQAIEQPSNTTVSTENRAQLQQMEDNFRNLMIRGREKEEKFQQELKTAEDEFWIWIETEYPDVFQEWQRIQSDQKAKIKQHEDKKRKDFEKIMGMMHASNAESNPGDDLEDAEYIREDD